MKYVRHRRNNLLNESIGALRLEDETRTRLSELFIQTVADLVQKSEGELGQSLPAHCLLDTRAALSYVGLNLGIRLILDEEPTPRGVPLKAEYLLYLFLPQKDRKCLPGDLAEEYGTYIFPRFGRKGADFWYWHQVMVSIWPMLWPRIRRLAVATEALKILEKIRRAAVGS